MSFQFDGKVVGIVTGNGPVVARLAIMIVRHENVLNVPVAEEHVGAATPIVARPFVRDDHVAGSVFVVKPRPR